MPASWVGASVRARLLANRRLGGRRIASLAKSPGLGEAITALADSPYSTGLVPGMSAEQAQRQVAATLLWNLRLIAGWLPPGGSQVLQTLAAWFEIANIEERLTYFVTGAHASPFQLGRLGVAWGAISGATSSDAVRVELAHSPWGDPRSSEPTQIVIWLRFRWASWVASSVPQAAAWSAAASTLMAARILLADPAPLMEPRLIHPYGLPDSWRNSGNLRELRRMLPRETAWVLDGIDDAAGLWRGEAKWWSRVRRDAAAALVGSHFGSSVVVAAVALLAFDAWLTRAALGAVARGDAARRVFDAVA